MYCRNIQPLMPTHCLLLHVNKRKSTQNLFKLGHRLEPSTPKSSTKFSLALHEEIIFILQARLQVSFSSPSQDWCCFGSHMGLQWHWWTSSQLPGFRNGLDPALCLPAPNRALNGIGRSVIQSSYCGIDLSSQHNLICQLNKCRVFNHSCSRLDYTCVWLMQDFVLSCALSAAVCCCLQESTVKRLDSGKFLWNVNSSSTHSSSWLLSFPLQREHTPHTFHPQSHPPTLCQPQSPLSHIGFDHAGVNLSTSMTGLSLKLCGTRRIWREKWGATVLLSAETQGCWVVLTD